MLERLSERVGPTGSLQGDGLANLLGRPPFDPLTLALREAGQNIWDARDRSGTNLRAVPKMLIRVRMLTDTQAKVLERLVESGEAAEDEPPEGNFLRTCLAKAGPVRVLEICDFGTTGLLGAVDPQSYAGNFVRFFFDIGSAHFDGGDGGTYGYGRSSLYLAGFARTILVDSLTAGAEPERRFMASRIGKSYEREVRGRRQRYTGRHFWGRLSDDRRVEPVVGRAAEGLARALGMPGREQGETGTTILIPWPDIPAADAGGRIVDIVLHNLWPKLVSSSGSRAMEIEVEEEGQPVAIPDPRSHPAYKLFVAALLDARTRSAPRATPMLVTSSKRITGHIAFAQMDPRPALGSFEGQDLRPERIFDRPVRHVALMRPSELVVRYLEFAGTGNDQEWAGVFLCAEEDQMMRAFASAEPPAHDDWVPDRLSGIEATLVRVTKTRRIPEAVNERFGPRTESILRDGISISLAEAADRFSECFLAGDGSAPGVSIGGASSTGGHGGKLQPLIFDGLSQKEGKKIASFRTAVKGGFQLSVVAVPGIEGITRPDDIPEGMELPVVKGWRHPDGSYTAGDECELLPTGNYTVEIEFRGTYAITAKCQPRDG